MKGKITVGLFIKIKIIGEMISAILVIICILTLVILRIYIHITGQIKYKKRNKDRQKIYKTKERND